MLFTRLSVGTGLQVTIEKRMQLPFDKYKTVNTPNLSTRPPTYLYEDILLFSLSDKEMRSCITVSKCCLLINRLINSIK